MDRDKRSPGSVRTSALFRSMFKTADPKRFLNENEELLVAPSFTEYLEALCVRGNAVREQVINRAGIERCFGHQLFRGSRKPSRDNVLRLAFGFGIDVEETQALLRAARKAPLYPRVKRDAAIICGLSHHYTMIEMQTLLHDMGLTELGGERYDRSER